MSRQEGGRAGGRAGRGKPKSDEHKRKISEALKRYARREDCHLPRVQWKPGPDHPDWKGGVRGTVYQRIAYSDREQVCERCGSTRYVVVHHKDRNRYNNTPDNLEILCRSCHSREHDLGGDVRQTTHCPQGHEYTPENTRYSRTAKGGQARNCRECGRQHWREWYERTKDERREHERARHRAAYQRRKESRQNDAH